MATLSANSRRNSASPTLANSPRPTIANGTATTESIKPSMEPLKEEKIVKAPIPLPPPSNLQNAHSDQTDNSHHSYSMASHLISHHTEVSLNGPKEKNERPSKEKTCTERSDSGFSDCSNSSNGVNPNVVHSTTLATASHPLFDKINSISEEKLNNDQSQRDNLKDFAGKVSVNMLKLKLEKIAEAQQDNKSNSTKKLVKKLSSPYVTESIDPMELAQIEQKSEMRTSYSFDFEDADMIDEYDSQPKSLPVKPSRSTIMRSASLHQKRIVEKEPIMKSDFTNTVKMRKKSLESNALRAEKQPHSTRILLEPSGKVSKLLRRFDSQNSATNGAQNENEPIVHTPSVDEESREIKNEDVSNIETSNCDDEVFEILSTPMAAAQISPKAKRKSPTKIAKSNVSGGSMKRTIASKHEYTNTKTIVTKVIMQRQSPTKFNANASNVPINRALPKAISNQSKNSYALKKSQKSTTADAATVAVQHRTPAPAPAHQHHSSTNKTTAYSSFNRTSPVRLSGRVKEVTDRLSTPKAIVKAPSPMKDRLVDAKFSTKNTMAQAVNEHHQMAMKSMSGTIHQQIVTVAEAVIETEHRVEQTINGKIDGTFTLKSKMNENFRKASAFWKTT